VWWPCWRWSSGAPSSERAQHIFFSTPRRHQTRPFPTLSSMVQAFRRPKCITAQMRFRLRGLDRRGTYLIENRDRSKVMRMSGRQLMEAGLAVQLDQPRQSALICYRRVSK
jgi:hypothetical protein